MKKLILSFAIISFIGVAKTFAQSSDAKSVQPATSAAAVTADPTTTNVTTVSGGQTVQTPATVKTAAKAESKKSCGNHSSKSCCMSKKEGSMKDCSHKQIEKAEIKSEDSSTKKD
jgi:hypothetical protein